MNNSEYIRISNSLKYIALYWNLGFLEISHDKFVKEYKSGYKISINADEQTIEFNNAIQVINGVFRLDSHPSFVVLELVNRLLELRYDPKEITIDLKDGYFVIFKNYKIRCTEWSILNNKSFNDKNFINVNYQSRLVSGCIEHEYFVFTDDGVFDDGLFVISNQEIILKHKQNIINVNKDFIIEGTKLISYKGHDKKVVVPNGITDFGPSVFWDNQEIEEVVLPETLINMGGDTFYNCFNLKEVTIPKSVKTIGDNPFGGCPNVNIHNESPYFVFEKYALYNKDKSVLIAYQINSPDEFFDIPSAVVTVGKHAFYMCNLKKITIPEGVYRLANNPFSNSKDLHIENHSKRYKVLNGVIYTSDMKTVIGALNSINCEELILEPVSVIARNVFFNCKGIKKIVLPKTLTQIGYNPFVACDNIEFVSHSDAYKVVDGVLYTSDMKKLVCYPPRLAVGEINIPDSVIELERGAFSHCVNMTGIHLHNVSIIGKSCFTNCKSLRNIYLSDLVNYVGEWAFAHCSNLKTVSIFKDTYLDKRVFENTHAIIVTRTNRSNYLIESENLYSLQSMIANYKNKIDCICIDPPYNSHIDYIGYKDGDYSEGYLNFINERIKLSYDLLSSIGTLIVNIDEGEYKNIEMLCSNVFGKDLVRVHRWKKKHPYFDANRVVLNPNKVQTDYEYIIIARKSKDSIVNKIEQPEIIDGKLINKLSDVPETFDCFGTTSSAKDEINELFGRRDYFSTPKPVKLIKEFVRMSTHKDSIVLDFFAGSGTTGHAVKELNDEDQGNRTFVLISNSESNICKSVTKRRLDIIKADFEVLD